MLLGLHSDCFICEEFPPVSGLLINRVCGGSPQNPASTSRASELPRDQPSSWDSLTHARTHTHTFSPTLPNTLTPEPENSRGPFLELFLCSVQVSTWGSKVAEVCDPFAYCTPELVRQGVGFRGTLFHRCFSQDAKPRFTNSLHQQKNNRKLLVLKASRNERGSLN